MLGIIRVSCPKYRMGLSYIEFPNSKRFFLFLHRYYSSYFYQHEQKQNTCRSVCMILLIGCYAIYRFAPQLIGGNIHMLFILFIAPMIITSVIYVPWLNKLLSTKFFSYLGSLSMEIYLLHFIVQCIFANIDIYCHLELNYSSSIVWITYTLSTIIVSIIYKQLFEKKCTNLFIQICNRIFVP